MNIILEKTNEVPYFTNMKLVLDSLGISASDFDWYISDVETNYCINDFISEDQWVCGEDLEKFLSANTVQFIWAVFSAVHKGHRPLVISSPYIEGNPDYWSGKEIIPQLQGALFEIACWDSSATILVGLPDQAIEQFIQRFPDTKPLQSSRPEKLN